MMDGVDGFDSRVKALAVMYERRAATAKLRRDRGEAAVIAVGRSVVESGELDDPSVIDAVIPALMVDAADFDLPEAFA